MDHFSISQLSQYSGIKPHTIRVWEQRYNALQPSRSEGNTRAYDGNQLRRLLNIVSLMESDYKVSQLCRMPDDQLFRLVREEEARLKGNDLNEYFISQLIAAGMEFDEERFAKFFSRCIGRYGMRNSYLQVICPMLERLGLMWAGDAIPPAHEHFVSNLVRQKLFTAIESVSVSEQKGGSWLLFLPENELHEISLLFASYILKTSAKKVFYLGTNVPVGSLEMAVKETIPENLLFFFVHYNLPESAQNYLMDLERSFPEQRIFFSGNEKLLGKLNSGERTHKLPAVIDLEEVLKENL